MRPARRRRLPVAALTVAGAAFGCRDAAVTVRPLAPSARTDNVAPSARHDLVIVGPREACLPDSYLLKVRCYTAGNGQRIEFGSEGSGPGEFRSVGPLVPVEYADSLVGVVDVTQRRLSVYSHTSGRPVFDFPLPDLFRPISPLTREGIVGLYLTYAREPQLVGHVVHVSSEGVVLRDFTVSERRREDDGDVRGFVRGLRLADGTLFLHTAGYRFHRFSWSGESLGTVALPTDLDQPVYPDEQDVSKYRRDLTSIFGHPPAETQVEDHRTRRRPPLVLQASLREGPGGTVWVAAARDRHARSLLDVFDPHGYLATFSVEGRLLAFDIHQGWLAALVEPPTAEDAAEIRRIDWYRLPSTPETPAHGSGS